MGGLPDRLQGQSDDPEREGGLSALDLAELPAVQRKIMRLMLRQVEMTYAELCRAAEAMPEAERLSRAELDEGLETLNGRHWLNRIEGPEHVSYKVNFRRKASRTLAKANLRRTGGARAHDIWDALEAAKESDKPLKNDDQ
jgi:hypothetical protein